MEFGLSGGGAAGAGSSVLGAIGNVAGTPQQVSGAILPWLDRKENRRQFDLQHGLAQDQWNFQKDSVERKRTREDEIRNYMLGFGK